MSVALRGLLVRAPSSQVESRRYKFQRLRPRLTSKALGRSQVGEPPLEYEDEYGHEDLQSTNAQEVDQNVDQFVYFLQKLLPGAKVQSLDALVRDGILEDPDAICRQVLRVKMALPTLDLVKLLNARPPMWLYLLTDESIIVEAVHRVAFLRKVNVPKAVHFINHNPRWLKVAMAYNQRHSAPPPTKEKVYTRRSRKEERWQ